MLPRFRDEWIEMALAVGEYADEVANAAQLVDGLSRQLILDEIGIKLRDLSNLYQRLSVHYPPAPTQ